VSGCSTDSVDVGSDVFGAIELENPVYFREIDTSGGNVCSEQDSLLTFKELVVDSSSLALLLSTMQLKEVGACLKSFECLVCISDLLAGRKEDKNFRFLMTFNKTEESVKLLINVCNHVMMEKFQWSNVLKLIS
jgi:hypothetical protein